MPSFQELGTSTGQTSAQLPQATQRSSFTKPGFFSRIKLKLPARLSAFISLVLVRILIFLFWTASFTWGLSKHMAHSSANFSGENNLPILTIDPPMVDCSSIIRVFIPCFARERAVVMPDMPPPITAALFLVRLSRGLMGSEYLAFSIAARVREMALLVALSPSECTQEHCSRILAICIR